MFFEKVLVYRSFSFSKREHKLGSLVSLTLDPCLKMLSVNQGGIKYHFSSLSYDSIIKPKQTKSYNFNIYV